MAGWHKTVSVMLLPVIFGVADQAAAQSGKPDTPVVLGIQRLPTAKAGKHPPIALQPSSAVFRADDYPAVAIRLNEQGRVSVKLVVGLTGQVVSCAIVGSSGSSSLDSTTCSIMLERMTYEPATDGRGRPVVGEIETSIRWELPTGSSQAFLPITAMTITAEFVVNANGQSRSCRFLLNGSEAPITPANTPCRFAPQVIADVLPMMKARQMPDGPFLLIEETRQTYGEPGKTADVIDVDLTELRHVDVRFTIHADGTASDCRVTGAEHPERYIAETPACSGHERFRRPGVGSAEPGLPEHDMEGVWSMITSVRPLPSRPGA